MARRIGWICLAFSLVAFFADTTEAQLFLRPARIVQTSNRFFGHGNGHGYHHCYPGHDSSYYNPWTQHNSALISRSPQFLARYGNELHRTPAEILQMGNVTWSQHGRYGLPQAGSTSLAAPLNADFVPSNSNSDSDADAKNDAEDSGGDFQPSPSDQDDDEVEDRFEEEADAFENLDDDEFDGGNDIGGFDSLEEAINSPAESAVLLTPQGVFKPASHSGR